MPCDTLEAAITPEERKIPGQWPLDALGGLLRAPNTAGQPLAPPRISVVIPLYNHKNFIEDTLMSVIGQTLQPAEIIVVDDGSTDGSARVIAQLVERYPDIIFWSHPNQGAHYTLNAAIHRATGDFVSILNSDDLYHRQRLEYCVRAMRDHPNASAVFTGVRFVDSHSHEIENAWYSQAIAFYEENADLSLALANANLVVSTSNLFLRRSVFAEIGYFAPLRYTHDLDFCLRLLARGIEIFFEDQALLAYRLHGSNTIAEDSERIDIERAAVLAFFLYQIYCHRTTTVAETWESYLTRFADILETQTLAKLAASFLSYLEGVARNEVDRLFLAPEAQFRSYLDASAIDWLSRGEQGSPARALSEDLARQRGQSDDVARKLQDAIAWHTEQNRRLLALLQQKEALSTDAIRKLQDAIAWHAEENSRLLALLQQKEAISTDEIRKLQDAIAWHAEENRRLLALLQQKEALSNDAIRKLQDAVAWHAEQNGRLLELLRQKEAMIADQTAWIATLEEAREWLTGQNQSLEQRLRESDAMKSAQ